MKIKLNLSALLVSTAFLAASSIFGTSYATKSEKVDGVEWDVTIKEVDNFNKKLLEITDSKYNFTVADTARVNAALAKEMEHLGDVTIGWTIPSADGSVYLVAYKNNPVFSEKITKVEATASPDGDVLVAFKFSDPHKWEVITKANLGIRIAVFVNGQLVNAPKVKDVIKSGNCSVLIPSDIIHEYLPTLDLKKLK